MQLHRAVQPDAIPLETMARNRLTENSACGLLVRTRMSRPMGLRLIRGHAGRGFALVLLAAFLCAVAVASSPRLHEKVHHVGSRHECAATLLASGNCEQAAAPQIIPTVEKASVALAFLWRRCQLVIATALSSILEHAPPAH